MKTKAALQFVLQRGTTDFGVEWWQGGSASAWSRDARLALVLSQRVQAEKLARELRGMRCGSVLVARRDGPVGDFLFCGANRTGGLL